MTTLGFSPSGYLIRLNDVREIRPGSYRRSLVIMRLIELLATDAQWHRRLATSPSGGENGDGRHAARKELFTCESSPSALGSLWRYCSGGSH